MLLTWLFCGLLLISFGSTQIAEPNDEVVAYGFMDDVYELWEAFERARQIGKEELEKLLNDERVQNTINSLKGFARKAALKVVQFFKDQLERLGRENNDNDYIILRELWDLLSKAAKAGRDALKRMIEDSKIKVAAAKLGNYARDAAIKILEFFENKLKEMEDSEVSTFMSIEPSEMSMSDILKRLSECQKISKEKVLEFLNSQELKDLLENLPPTLKAFIETYIEKLRNKLQESDDESESTYMGEVDSEALNSDKSWADILAELRDVLVDALKLGKENLLQVIESERVQNLLDRLPRWGRALADKLIEKLKNEESAYMIPFSGIDDTEISGSDESEEEALDEFDDDLLDALLFGKKHIKRILKKGKRVTRRIGKSIVKKWLERIKSGRAYSMPQIVSEEEALVLFPNIREKLQEIINKVSEAAKNGAEKLKEILSDEEFLEKIKSLPRRIRAKFMDYVEKLKEMLEEKKESNLDEVEEAFEGFGLVDSFKEIIQKVRETLKEGRDRFLELVNDPEFQEKVKNLPSFLREKVQNYIEKLREKINAKGENDTLKQIVDYLRDAYQRGKDALKEALESEKLQELLSKLNDTLKNIAEKIIEKFRQLVDRM